MNRERFLEAVDFINKIKIKENDITTEEQRLNGQCVVEVDYHYGDKIFRTKPLYYLNVNQSNEVRHKTKVNSFFGEPVFWLDNTINAWPQDSGTKLANTVIVDMANSDDVEFLSFLNDLANDDTDGWIQWLTWDGRSAQYSINLENNNHWHDLVLLLKAALNSKGAAVDKKFFSKLVFQWQNGERASLHPSFGDRAIISSLYKNIMSIQTELEMKNIQEVLLYKKQIILQGPPGTGKTYTAKDLAEQVIFGNITSDKKAQKKRLEESGQFELVQFHPSYSYEDFVRGITAKSKGDKIEYVTEDRIFASFAKKAFMNFVSSTKGTEIISKKEWAREKLADYAEIVQEKIDSEGEYRLTDKVKLIDTDENAFYYTGDNWFDGIRHRMKFNDIVEAYLSNPVDKKSFKLLDNISGSAKQHYGYYYNVLEKFRANLTTEYTESRNDTVASQRKYVMIIDEINRANLPTVLGELIYALEYRGESINSLYEITEGDRSITIPENLYIIGTMNTADRSVGHIDYAIRRRFAFKDILPDPAPIHEAGKEYFDHISGLFIKDYKTDKTRRTKSECLASDFKPEQVWLGHSYFITKEPTEENQLPSEQEQMEQKLETEILPILREYVSDGILLEEETKMHLLKLDIIL